jgi:hypothetical protein
LVGKLKERDHLENLDVNVRIILVVFDINSMACIGFIWPRIGHVTSCEHVHKNLRSLKLRESEYLTNYHLLTEKLLWAVNYNVHAIRIKKHGSSAKFFFDLHLKNLNWKFFINNGYNDYYCIHDIYDNRRDDDDRNNKNNNNDKNLCAHLHLPATTKPKQVEFKSTSFLGVVTIHKPNTTLHTRYLCD